MTRKLHLVPIVHEISLNSIIKKIEEEIVFKETQKEISQNLMSHLNLLFSSLKNEPMDVIFHEGVFRSYNVVDIIDVLLPSQKKIIEFAKYKKSRIEKTEDKAYWKFHNLISEFSIYFYKYFPKIADNPLINAIIGKSEKLIRRRRDYNMARNVSRRLMENETGILFYGRDHHPENYVKMLSPDMEIISHPYQYHLQEKN